MAAPKLQLDVTLNLAAFRKDLGKVAQAAAAYYYPVNLLINKKNFEAQLKVLSKIKPIINIEDSQLIGARTRIATLNKSLATLRRATATPIEIKIKYKEVGKPPSGATAQIGKAVSGGIKAEQALQGLSYKQAQAARQMMVAASIPVGALGKNRSMEAYMKSLTEGMKNAGEQSITGLAQGLKNGKSAVGQAAKGVGESGLRALKDFWGIASPSRVFKQIGEFAVDGLELGFLNGLKDFKSKSISEVRKITAALKFELAKIGAFVAGEPAPLPRATGPQTPWRQSWSQFLQQRQQPSPPQGSRAYTSPIGPLPLNSQDPWAPAGAGYTPRLASSIYQRSPQFPMSGMMGPSSPNPSYAPRNSFLGFSQRATQVTRATQAARGGGGPVPSGGFPVDGAMVTQRAKLNAVMDAAIASNRSFAISQIPIIGGLKDLAGEFGQATKQVLLYGTAYKGLAFLTSLPGQILNAAKSQQQFTNGLKTATQDTGTFAKELLYVDNVQRAFGLNLETTRTGFTRLYASMAPTGFDSGSIEKLFTGISAATAALQLTPDKAERVIYAFGQMASKGQIMSEELKGQLGDVLPGALAIFSKAAGMSVKEFSEAMEDGEFKGQRFREVFAKVSDELMNRFGTGAQAAGKSLQGLINTVGGDFQRTLESFAPLANAAAQATLGPLAGMLKEVSVAAQLAMGEQDRVKKQLEAAQSDVSALKTGGADPKEIKAAEQNVAALTARYESLNEAAKDPAIAQQVKNIEAFVVEIQKAATFTKNLAGVIGSVLSPVFTFLGGNLTSVIGNLALFALAFNAVKLAALLFTGVLAALNAAVLTGGNVSVVAAVKNTILAGVFKLIGVQATGATIATIGFGTAVKGLLASTGIGLLVVLLGSVATAFLSVGNSAKEAADKAKRSIDSMKDAARTGNVAIIEMDLAINKADRQDLENLIKSVEQLKGRKGARGVELVTLTPEQKREAKRLGVEVGKEISKGSLLGSLEGLRAPLKKVETEGLQDLVVARQRADKLGLNKPDPATTQAEDTLQDTKKTNLESFASLQDQLANAQTQADIDRIQALFDHRRSLINSVYDLEEARANSMQKEAIAHQRAISDIFLDRQKKEIDARLEVMKAEGSVAGGASSAEAGGKSLANGIAQYITGDPSSPFYAADHGGGNYHEHLAFVSRQAAEEAYNKLTSAGIQVTEFKGKGPVGRHTPGSAHYKGLAFDVPGAQVPVGQERELTARVQSILGIGGKGAGAPSKVTGDQKRDALATQSAVIAKQKESINLTYSQVEAEQALIVQTEKYLAQIFGIAEKELQTSMLQKKTAMLRAGATEQEIEDAMSLEELNLKYAEGIKTANDQIAFNNKLKEKGIISQDELNKRNAYQNALIERLNEELPKATAAQKALNKAAAEYAFTGRIQALKEEIRLLRIINEDERRLAELTKQYGGDKAKAKEVFDLEKIKKNIEDTRALIGDFVSSTSSDYKGFLKAVISGEDAADALKQFQEGLKDRVLTIFLDFAMAPVEKFLKESLEGLFLPKGEKLPGTEIDKEVTKDPVEATNSNTNATNTNTEAIKNLTNTLSTAGAGGAEQATSSLSAAMQSIGGVAFDTNVGAAPMQGFDAASVFGNPEALKESFAGVQESLSQSMGGISSSFEDAASSISETLPSWNDALTTKIPESLTKATNETDAEIPSFQESLGKVAQGIGIAASTIMGIAAGISQIKEGGTGNVLMGIGSIMTSIGGGIGGFTNLFGANGGVADGGWKPFPVSAFANGGMVSGPTLGLVGEGKYNEAIVPLPDGRSIPVKMQGESIRDKMGGGAAGAMASPMLSMSFQSTTINGVEYVDRAQLEAAMAETRRMASKEGASRGANLALDKLANSPSSRRRVGLR